MTLEELQQQLDNEEITQEEFDAKKAELEDPEEKITLSKDELEKEKQREADRRVAKALENAQAKWEKDFEKKMQEQLKEREELAKLSEKERQEKEFENQQKQFEQERLKFEREKLKYQAERDLLDKGLPTEIAPYVLGENAEQTLETINGVHGVWQKAIEEEVNKRLATDKPSVGASPKGGENPFAKETQNLTEQGRLIRNEPDKAKKYIQQAGYDPTNYGL